MPPTTSINRDFLRQVLKGEKSLLPKSACKFVNVPMYDELSVKNVYPKFKNDTQVMQFLQDTYPRDRLPDRTYFFTVLNTMHPNYVSKMIAHANEQRFSSKGEAK